MEWITTCLQQSVPYTAWLLYIFLMSYFNTVVDCGSLSNINNGQVNTSSGTTYKQTATYSCGPGYNIVGFPSRTCQANGTWSLTAPVCECEYNFN